MSALRLSPMHALSRRSTLLTVVIGLHVAVGLAILTAKTVVPALQESPLFVEFLPVSAPKPPEVAKPQPQIKPAPARPAPKPLTPPLETTSSTVEAPSAPLAPPAPAKPVIAPAVPPVSEPVLSQARFDADYLNNPAPPYPPLARRMGEEGKVILRVQVSPQGSADQVEVRTSSGSTRLDEAALKTVRTWKFIPAKRGDIPVSSTVLVPIIFKLEQ